MSHASRFPTQRLRAIRAFTLVELLVVIAVIAILLATSVPLVRAVLQANALDNGLNQVSAALNSARAIALRDGTDAAVFFVGGPDGRVNLRIVKFTGTITGTGRMQFTDLDDRPPERLPLNIGVRGYSATSFTPVASPVTNWSVPAPLTYDPRPDSTDQSTTYVAVWFGADGTTRTSTSAGVESLEYLPVTGGTTTLQRLAVPVPLLLVYDHRAYGEYFAGLSPATPSIDNWIQDPNISTKTTIRLVNFNRYSGLIVNR